MAPTFARRRRLAGAGSVGLVAVLLVAACTSDDGADPDDPADRTDATVLGDGTDFEATIHRDAAGVPHVVADDEASLAFGQGWASAEDRSCDLADQVVKIRGERAATFGPGEDDEHIESDFAWQTIGIHEIAVADWAEAPIEVRDLFTAYAAGWNAHLAEVGANGIDGWCAGADWLAPVEPVDVYAYARAIALQASSSQLTGFLGAQPPEGDDDASDVGNADATPARAPHPPRTEPVVASNGWAIGAERSAGGGGMLVANPHFPWEGELRFWEVHLTVPGEIDIYGAQLSGLPGIGIGFTETFGWTHTVSAGSRFTAYRLDLVPGSPTTYVYGDGEREMDSRDLTVEVRRDDGTTEAVSRTAWYSHYGPIIDFPGFGWTESATISFRDANLDNDEFALQYLRMMQARDLDEFIAVHAEVTGVPLFNTIAVSADGRTWYADTSATPNLSAEAIDAYEESLETDPIVAIAAESRAVLLDGSDPRFEWVDEPGARDAGLVPFSAMPAVERDDYVFNANDSFWLPHAIEVLEGDYSPLHGAQRTARSPRTRENALVLDAGGADADAAGDGRFTLESLADTAIANVGFTARALRAPVVDRCRDAAAVALDVELDGEDEVLPAATVDLDEACGILDRWDGRYDLDSIGAVLWREFLNRFEPSDLDGAGALWAEPFDPADPVGTPAGLAAAPGDGADPVLEHLARAVQVLEAAGLDLDVPLGEAQFARRGDSLVPIHGGTGRDGVTNIVGWGRGWSTLEPIPERGERAVPATALTTVGDRTGYEVNNGTSFLLALEYTDAGPDARVFLTYGNTQDRDAPAFVEATERFSAKEWREVRFPAARAGEGIDRTTTVVRG